MFMCNHDLASPQYFKNELWGGHACSRHHRPSFHRFSQAQTYYGAASMNKHDGQFKPHCRLLSASTRTAVGISILFALLLGVWHASAPLRPPLKKDLSKYRDAEEMSYTPRKIFLDVGVHEGQTLEEVATPENPYGFHEVHAFDPSLKNMRRIEQQFQGVPYLYYHNFGLANFTSDDVTLFSAGTLGGTIIKDDTMEFPDAGVEHVHLVQASKWFHEHLRLADEVFLKINCEGCEAWIIPDLVRSGAMKMVTWAMIDFDVRKHAATQDMESQLRQSLERYAGSWTDQSVMVGPPTHQLRVRQWLCKKAEFFSQVC